MGLFIKEIILKIKKNKYIKVELMAPNIEKQEGVSDNQLEEEEDKNHN